MGAEIYPDQLLMQAQSGTQTLQSYLLQLDSVREGMLQAEGAGIQTAAWTQMIEDTASARGMVEQLQLILQEGIADQEKLQESICQVMNASGGGPLIEDELVCVLESMKKTRRICQNQMNLLQNALWMAGEDPFARDQIYRDMEKYRILRAQADQTAQKAREKLEALRTFLRTTGALFEGMSGRLSGLAFSVRQFDAVYISGKSRQLQLLPAERYFAREHTFSEKGEAFVTALLEGRYTDAFLQDPEELGEEAQLFLGIFAHSRVCASLGGDEGAVEELEKMINAMIATDPERSMYPSLGEEHCAFGLKYLTVLKETTSELIDVETARLIAGDEIPSATAKQEFVCLTEENSLWGALEKVVWAPEGLALCLEQTACPDAREGLLFGTRIQKLHYQAGAGFAMEAVYSIGRLKDPCGFAAGKNVTDLRYLEDAPLYVRAVVNHSLSQISLAEYEDALHKLKKKKQKLAGSYGFKAVLNLTKTLFPVGGAVFGLVQSVSGKDASGTLTGVENILEKTGVIDKETKKVAGPAVKEVGVILDYYKELKSLNKQIAGKETYGKVLVYGATSSFEARCSSEKSGQKAEKEKGKVNELREITKTGFYHLEALENLPRLHESGICSLLALRGVDTQTACRIRDEIGKNLDQHMEEETMEAVQTILYGVSRDNDGKVQGRRLQSFGGGTLLKALQEIEYAYDCAYTGNVKILGENVDVAALIGS